MDLLCGDSDSEVDFTINEKYARRYEKWRRGEEIQKLKDKYGDVEESDSSTSEEEDEDGKELTKDVEKQFYKTLSCLKERNPKIYDQNVRFFDKEKQEKKDEEVTEKKKNEQTLTLAGYQRKVLLETGGQFSDNEDEDGDDEKRFEMMSSQDQENEIKQSFKDILKDSDNEDEGQWGNLFTKRVKTAEELEKEEEDFKQWLIGEKEKLKDEKMKEELKGLHDYWADPKLDEGEKFLRDYIINKRYLDEDSKNRIPSYDEIVHDSDSNLSADDDMIEKQDEFERKYNFRFEEPDREFIKRYPRTLEQSMRKKDERRKQHREDVKQRKQAERSKKDEELKRLKTLKKKEIMDKIKKLQQITGNDDIAFQTEDLEGDFDPEKYDQRMSQIFNDDYYGTGEDEEEKPEFPEYDEELGIENWDNWDGHGEEDEEGELHCEDPGFNMDCDYDPTKKKELQQELIENSKRRKKRRKSKFAEALEREKPVFDPKDKTFEQYVDEYYALDYEDLIGDIPCRFKYRKVVPNDFGLSIDEILNATDQELNRWVSIKKITRRLPEHVEQYDVKAYKKKAANVCKKAKCFPSLFRPKDDELEPRPSVENNREFGKKGKKKSEFVNQIQPFNVEDVVVPEDTTSSEKKKKKKKKKKNLEGEGDEVVDSGDVVNESQNGFNVGVDSTAGEESVEGNKKKKNKRKRKLEEMDTTGSGETKEAPNPVNGTEGNTEGGQKKKKRRKKSKGGKQVATSGEEQISEGVKNEKMAQKSKKRKHSLVEGGSVENKNKVEGKRKNKKRKLNNNGQRENAEKLCSLSDERLRSYGLNPKKYKNKLKYKNKNN